MPDKTAHTYNKFIHYIRLVTAKSQSTSNSTTSNSTGKNNGMFI